MVKKMKALNKLTTDKNEQRNLLIMGSGQILQQANNSVNSPTLQQGLMLKLNFSNSQIALVGFPGWIINLVMTFCASFFVDKVTNKAKVFALFYLFTAIPTVGAVFITLGGSLLQNTTVAFYVMMSSTALSSFCSPVYAILSYTVYMRAIHNNIRGRYTAISGIISGILGMLGGEASIDEYWKAPTHGMLDNTIVGAERAPISTLVDKTMKHLPEDLFTK